MYDTLAAEGGISESDMLQQQLRWSYTGSGTYTTGNSQTEVIWDVTGEEGLYKVLGEGAWCYSGHSSLFQQASSGVISVSAVPMMQ